MLKHLRKALKRRQSHFSVLFSKENQKKPHQGSLYALNEVFFSKAIIVQTW